MMPNPYINYGIKIAMDIDNLYNPQQLKALAKKDKLEAEAMAALNRVSSHKRTTLPMLGGALGGAGLGAGIGYAAGSGDPHDVGQFAALGGIYGGALGFGGGALASYLMNRKDNALFDKNMDKAYRIENSMPRYFYREV